MLYLVIVILALLLLGPLRRPLFVGRGKRWLITIPVCILMIVGGSIGYFLGITSKHYKENLWLLILLGAVIVTIEGLPLILNWLAGIFNQYKVFNDTHNDNN